MGYRKEVAKIRTSSPIQWIVYHPKTLDAETELKQHATAIHADSILRQIQALHVPPEKKLELLDTIIEMARREESNPIQR